MRSMRAYDPTRPAWAVEGVCWMTCCNCASWRPDVLAFPGDKPGSQRVCAKGHINSAGQWCQEFEVKSEKQAMVAAQTDGRLF